jgi:AraC-like DNA-binding protein
MVEVGDRPQGVDLLFGRWGRELIEIVRNAERVDQKIDFIQRQLITLLTRSRLQNSIVEFCVSRLRTTDGLISVSELERQTGYTQRHLEALFNTQVGLSPKTLGRIFRFQRFYREWAKGRSFSQLKTEVNDYYYDQAHFTKEFKRMTGFSPEDFTLTISNEFGRCLALQRNSLEPTNQNLSR